MASLNEPDETPDPRRESQALGGDIAAMQVELDRIVQVAGLKNDPVLPLLTLLTSSLRLHWRLHDHSVRYFYDASDRLDRQYHETIQKTALVLKRGEQALEARQIGIVEQLAPKIAAGVNEAVRQRVKIVKIKTLAGWGIAVLAVALLPTAFAYTAGLSTGRSEGEAAGQTIQDAMKGGPDAALQWALLMADNNPLPEMKACRTAISTGDDGRRYCAMPVWLDPPSTAPRQ